MRAYIREIQFIEIEKYILPDTKNTFQNTHFQKRLINTNIWLKHPLLQLTIHARPKFMIWMKEDEAQNYCCIIRHCTHVLSNQEILIVNAFENIPPSPCAHIKTSRTTGSFVGIANSFFLEDLKTETSPIESGLAQSASLAKIEILKPRWCRAAENMAFEKYYFHLIFLHLPFSFVRHQKWPNAELKLSNKKVQLFAI